MIIYRSRSGRLAKTPLAAAAAAALLAGATTVAADPRGGDGYQQQSDRVQQSDHQHDRWGRDQPSGHHWQRGERMGYDDWSGAQRVDYRQHHLRHPPRGYEWRKSNGQYVLAAVATGVIASIILSNDR